MKIALLSPAGAMHRFSGSFSKSLHYAPLTLTLLAALVPQELEAKVEIYDETIEEIPKNLDVDLIGTTVITGTSSRAYRWANYYRSKGVKVVLGGIHPTLMPNEAKEYADAVVVGQAEESWPRLLRDFKVGQMRSFYYQQDNFSLEGRRIPNRELFERKKFITKNSIEATRGCINDCSFCAVNATFGKTLYKRPIFEVVAEIEQLAGKDVLFVDVNLTADKEYAKALFRELVPLNKWWFGLVTADVIEDAELFDLMVASGCKGLLIGFESVSNSSLADINKSHNQRVDYDLLMKKLHNSGIVVNGTFCFGTDMDDKDVFKRTVEQVIELKIDLPRFSILTPFPGTKLYQNLKHQDRIIESDWALYDVQHAVFKPKNMTPQELEEGLAWAWKETYKLSSIARRLSRFHMLFPINLASNLGYRSYGRRLKEFPKAVMIDNSDIDGEDNYEDNIHLTSNR